MPVLPRFDLRGRARDAGRVAHAFPSAATRLARTTADPHTERLVEGAQFLAGTVLEKIEDYQLDAHEALAERVCPWLRRPIPAATIVAFDGGATEALSIGEDAPVIAHRDGVACTFRPIRSFALPACRVREATVQRLGGRGSTLRLIVEAADGAALNEALSKGLRLYVDGDREDALALVHAVTTGLALATVTSPDWTQPIELAQSSVWRASLTADEALAPDPDGLPPAFGVVTEAIVFPDRFRFFVVRAPAASRAPTTSCVTVTFTLREPLAQRVPLRAEHLRTDCAVVRNLFEASSEPMALDFERGPMPIRVAGMPARAGHVYAVREAWSTATRGEHGPVAIPDARRLGAVKAAAGSPAAFSCALDASRGEPVAAIAFCPMPGHAADGVDRTVSLALLATNGVHAARLRTGDVHGEFEGNGRAVRYRNVVPSSAYVSPPTGHAFALRAVRHAAVPLGGGDLTTSLRDALYLAVPSWAMTPESARAAHQRIEAVRSFDVSLGRRTVAHRALQHGYAYRLVVDETPFQGTGELGLFSAVLAEALSRTAAVNTFAELTVVGVKTGFRATFGRERS